MSSGVTINDECHSMYNDLKGGAKKYRYIGFVVASDCKSIEVDHDLVRSKSGAKTNAEKLEDSDNALKELCEKLSSLSDSRPRWVFFDYEYTNLATSSNSDKVALIKWCPEHINIKQRMLFSSSDNNVKQALNYGGPTVMCDDIDEVKNIKARLEKGELK